MRDIFVSKELRIQLEHGSRAARQWKRGKNLSHISSRTRLIKIYIFCRSACAQKTGKSLIYDSFDSNSNDIKMHLWGPPKRECTEWNVSKRVFHMPSRSLLSIFAKCSFCWEHNLWHPLLFRITRIEFLFGVRLMGDDKCYAPSNRFEYASW